jgi:methionyl-tRNA formyltransferase
MKSVFAGDRMIAVRILEFLLNRGEKPELIWLSPEGKSSHSSELSLLSGLTEDRIIYGNEFKSPLNIEKLRKLEPDVIVCIHFPLIVPKEVLDIPKLGVINLHPAYLPYNRGWHTPSWAIIEGTPYGATLHFMSSDVVMGPIIGRQALTISPSDTAHDLYQKVQETEYELFTKAWPEIVSGTYGLIEQNPANGSTHRRDDLFQESIQRLILDESVRTGDLIDRLRGLTTSQLSEAAYYIKDGTKYRIQVKIVEDE